jgi:hypothetical protein
MGTYDQDADIRYQKRTESIKEPPVGVDLLLVSLLEEENDLRRDNAFIRVSIPLSILQDTEVGIIGNPLEVQIGVQPKRRCVLKHVGRNGLAVHLVLHIFALIHTQRCETIEYSGMDLLSTIRDDADNHLYVRLRFSTLVGEEEEGGPSSSSLDPRLCSTCVDRDGRCSS